MRTKHSFRRGKSLRNFAVYGLEGFPMIKGGDNLAETIVDTSKRNGLTIQDHDVIVIAQKVISKAEMRVLNLKKIVPSRSAKRLAKATGKDAGFLELVLRETRNVLKAKRGILIVRDKRGLICINAGIDKSNIEGKWNYAMLPENPDESAEKYRSEIRAITGKDVAIIICDTYSRPFRRGQVNFAIGVAGIGLFRDYRGKKDLFGNVLRVKNVAVVDELAATAELLMGQGAEGIPVAIVRGLETSLDRHSSTGIGELLISGREDLFKGVL